MKELGKILFCMAMAFVTLQTTVAQEISIVSGKVLNLPEGEKKARPFPVTEKVYVFAFNTVAAARDALKQLEGGGGTMMSDADAVAGADGYYEIRVRRNRCAHLPRSDEKRTARSELQTNDRSFH